MGFLDYGIDNTLGSYLLKPFLKVSEDEGAIGVFIGLHEALDERIVRAFSIWNQPVWWLTHPLPTPKFYLGDRYSFMMSLQHDIDITITVYLNHTIPVDDQDGTVFWTKQDMLDYLGEEERVPSFLDIEIAEWALQQYRLLSLMRLLPKTNPAVSGVSWFKSLTGSYYNQPGAAKTYDYTISNDGTIHVDLAPPDSLTAQAQWETFQSAYEAADFGQNISVIQTTMYTYANHSSFRMSAGMSQQKTKLSYTNYNDVLVQAKVYQTHEQHWHRRYDAFNPDTGVIYTTDTEKYYKKTVSVPANGILEETNFYENEIDIVPCKIYNPWNTPSLADTPSYAHQDQYWHSFETEIIYDTYLYENFEFFDYSV